MNPGANEYNAAAPVAFLNLARMAGLRAAGRSPEGWPGREDVDSRSEVLANIARAFAKLSAVSEEEQDAHNSPQALDAVVNGLRTFVQRLTHYAQVIYAAPTRFPQAQSRERHPRPIAALGRNRRRACRRRRKGRYPRRHRNDGGPRANAAWGGGPKNRPRFDLEGGS